jgi:hypothetical protein
MRPCCPGDFTVPITYNGHLIDDNPVDSFKFPHIVCDDYGWNLSCCFHLIDKIWALKAKSQSQYGLVIGFHGKKRRTSMTWVKWTSGNNKPVPTLSRSRTRLFITLNKMGFIPLPGLVRNIQQNLVAWNRSGYCTIVKGRWNAIQDYSMPTM